MVIQQDAKLKKQSEQIKRYEQQIQHSALMEQDFNNERNFYKEQINELVFHNQNLGKINMELGQQNQIFKENLANYERYIE